MNILHAFKGTLEKARRMLYLPQKANYRDHEFRYGGDTNQGGYGAVINRQSSADQLYSQQKSWVFNAVSLRSEIDLMLSPSPYFTWYDLIYITVQNLDIQGNFYTRIRAG